MEKFRASDGKELAYLRFDPKNEAKAVVIVGHGMNDHKERFMHLAEALTPIGVSVWIQT